MKKIWLIGAGPMAEAYYNVLAELKQDVTIIGRSKATAEKLSKKINKLVIEGGLSKFIKHNYNQEVPDIAIVAVGVESLAATCCELISHGVKKILVEKPAGINTVEIKNLNNIAIDAGVDVYVAYNRRFYAAVERATEIIREDGGVVSFNFEFTEWSNRIAPVQKGKGVKDQWLLANSTHVIDLAFFLGGTPKEISCYYAGSNELEWHSSASRFSGAGISSTGALFSYCADWCAPGRWGVEVLTKYHRLIFRPMEQLQIQQIDSIVIEAVNDIDYMLDEKFKPGLYKQVYNFLELNSNNSLCCLSEHIENLKYYQKISGKTIF